MSRSHGVVLLASLLISALSLPACAADLQEQTPAASAPQNAKPRVIRVSGGVMAGHQQSKVDPVYPQAAKDAHISGTVVLAALIGIDGSVQDLKVVSGPPELTEAAIDAVKQWTYKPFLLNGEPVQVNTTVTINFNLAS